MTSNCDMRNGHDHMRLCESAEPSSPENAHEEQLSRLTADTLQRLLTGTQLDMQPVLFPRGVLWA